MISRRLAVFCLFLLVLAFLAGSLPARAGTLPLAGKVTWIYDGDTLKIQKVGKVRLLGIDAPEHEDSLRDRYYQRWKIPPSRLRAIAAEARQFLLREVKGKQVTLTFDQVSRDKYDRLLVYLELPDGRLLNQVLLERGYASVFRKFDFSRKNDFLRSEERARKAGVGLWRQP
ncbi:thermonuclease family protein [Desulfuromonas carbonis]|uniref:thermonuclease family protein n=1 Tax=Desulfuromonas sp. DDH964 TaxID=1823759 RepID=UPI00078ED96F|nr:thermonuclease family protein [Desulfuromonas sp. DDH964]AMV73466.1 nuclease [Desulfuromonas sp. DDH964]